MPTVIQTLSRKLAESTVFGSTRQLWASNARSMHTPLSKIQKLKVGIYLVLNDYSQGRFPPSFLDQQATYDGEINYHFSLPGISPDEVRESDMRKPFWFGKDGQICLEDFNYLISLLVKIGIYPPNRLIELGSGSGWMSEFLATMGFDVLGTTISADDVSDAKRRIRSLEVKNLPAKLDFIAVPMESVDQIAVDGEGVDGVFVYEALHHAYDWKKAVQSSYSCLNTGGWFLICKEPNIVHTLKAYRIAKLTNTHEIGFKRSELMAHLRAVGFRNIQIPRNKFDDRIHPHWILAQK